MIKFFRRIRKSLLMKNKTGMYFKYAIGEIILVVIGILIALQINTLNENRKISDIRQLYYKQLLQDFEKDKSYTEKIILDLNSNMAKYETYREIFKEPDLPLSQILQNFRKLVFFTTTIQFKSNTIATLENTGDIKLIPPIIRNKLINLRKEQDLIINYSNTNNALSNDASLFASRYFGSRQLLTQNIVNQPKLAKYIFDENHLIQIIMALESSQEVKKTSETQALVGLKKMLLKIDVIAELVNNELNN